MEYSVLMSVYYREKPEQFRESLLSILHQTIPTDNFVLVCDGPLTKELDAVIEEMRPAFGESLQVVRLPENKGLGRALNEGLRFCRHEMIARMDSDDISRPDRCQKELNAFASTGADIISGTVEEFSGSIGQVRVCRALPEKHEDILAFARRRNPFNHPCVMYRKSAVEAAGGYQDFYLLEDYYLWVRMLLAGSRGYNLQEPLLWMRAGSDMYRRRSGISYARSQRDLFRYMKNQNFIGTADYYTSCLVRTASSLAPNWLRERLFRQFVRNKGEKS